MFFSKQTKYKGTLRAAMRPGAIFVYTIPNSFNSYRRCKNPPLALHFEYVWAIYDFRYTFLYRFGRETQRFRK